MKGQLKLIDFGIANAIANDTTNIQRDHQIGTVNYMSPEAIELPEGMRRLKVGRPSDVWSLGCILYQMVYGQPPFGHITHPMQKMRAIPDENHIIDFPEYAVPMGPRNRSKDAVNSSPPQKLEHLKVRVPQSIITTMKSCLVRNPKARATIPELLQQNWLEREFPASFSLDTGSRFVCVSRTQTSYDAARTSIHPRARAPADGRRDYHQPTLYEAAAHIWPQDGCGRRGSAELDGGPDRGGC